MRLWVDDVRPAPEGYEWCQSVNEAIEEIILSEWHVEIDWKMYETTKMVRPLSDSLHRWKERAENEKIELIDIDHDAGDYADQGGDFIKVLDYMEEHYLKAPIRIHSANAVGVANMRQIIERNGWKEVK